MKKLAVLFTLVLVLLVAACGGKPGSEYEGKWIAITKSWYDGTKIIRKMDIKRNGDNFIITPSVECNEVDRSNKGSQDNAPWKVTEQKPISATLKDGRLSIMSELALTYVKDKGTILGYEGEIYVKDTPEVFAKMKKESEESFLVRQKLPKEKPVDIKIPGF